MHFLSCNFCLKKRQGEPSQFKTRLRFGGARQLVKLTHDLASMQGRRYGHNHTNDLVPSKTQVRHDVSQRTFCGIRTRPTWAWKIVCWCFMRWMHQTELCDPYIHPDAKTPVWWNVSLCAFLGSAPGPPEHEKYCLNIWHPGRTRTHYVTCRSHRMHKHQFSITCPYTLFAGSAPGPPKHEK
jgi:hypothetical protein